MTTLKSRPRRRRGISRSGVRLIERIVTGNAPQRQRRLSAKNATRWWEDGE